MKKGMFPYFLLLVIGLSIMFFYSMADVSNKELNMVIGGAISGAIITSVIKGVGVILELGRCFGSALRRLINKNYC